MHPLKELAMDMLGCGVESVQRQLLMLSGNHRNLDRRVTHVRRNVDLSHADHPTDTRVGQVALEHLADGPLEGGFKLFDAMRHIFFRHVHHATG